MPSVIGSTSRNCHKIYGNDSEGQTRYSPAQCLGTKRVEVIGNPKEEHISTSYVERQNLNMRMQMRRFTRLTNAFSKKLDNHIAMIALFHMYHNFGRVHQTLRVTPAMEAGIERPCVVDSKDCHFFSHFRSRSCIKTSFRVGPPSKVLHRQIAKIPELDV